MADKLKFTKKKLLADGLTHQLISNDSQTQHYIRHNQLASNFDGLDLTLKANGLTQARVKSKANQLLESYDSLLLGPGESLELEVSPEYVDLETPVYMHQGSHSISDSRYIAHSDYSKYIHSLGPGSNAFYNSQLGSGYDDQFKPVFKDDKHYIYQLKSGAIRRVDMGSGTDIDSVLLSDNASPHAFCINHDASYAWIMKNNLVFSRYIIQPDGITWVKDSAFGDKVGSYVAGSNSIYYKLEYFEGTDGTGWLLYCTGADGTSDTQVLRYARADDLSSDSPLTTNSNYTPYRARSISNFARLHNSDGSSSVIYNVSAVDYYNIRRVVKVSAETSPYFSPVIELTHGTYYPSNHGDIHLTANSTAHSNTIVVLDHSRNLIAIAVHDYTSADSRYWLQFDQFNNYMGALDTWGTIGNEYFVLSNPPELDGSAGQSSAMPEVEIQIQSVETTV